MITKSKPTFARHARLLFYEINLASIILEKIRFHWLYTPKRTNEKLDWLIYLIYPDNLIHQDREENRFITILLSIEIAKFVKL